MKGEKICLCMVVKNEERTLAMALDSIKNFVDKIVICDNLSTDKTKEIAKKYTPYVYDYDNGKVWNFAKARNFVSQKAKENGEKCEWEIIMDADEMLDQKSGPILRKVIEKASENIHEVLCRVTVPDVKHPESNIPALTHLCHRYFRPDKTSWAGSGHNHLLSSPRNRIISYDINFFHNRKNKDPERNKERNVQRFEHLTKALKKTIKENPDHPRSYFYLGSTYRDYKHYKEAVTYYKAYLKRTRWVEEKYQAIIYLAQCLLQLDKIDEAFNILLLALEVDSGRCEAEYLLGQIAEGRKLYNQAKFWYEAAIKPIPNRALFIEGRYYTYGPVDKLSLVYWKLGKKEGALKYVKKALEYVPTDKRFQKNVEVIEKSLKGGKNVILK